MIRAIAVPISCLLAVLAGPPSAPAQVELGFKFPEGQKSTYESLIVFDQTLTIQGQAITTMSRRDVTLTSEVGAPREGGVTPVTQTFGPLKAELSLPGGIEMTIDSENPEEPEGELPQLSIIRKLITALQGIHYTILFGPDGAVTGVEGIEEAISDDLEPEIANGLRQELDAESLTRALQQEYGIFPDEPVSPGQTWEREDVLDLREAGTLTFQRTYSYEGTVERDGKTLDRIGLTASAVDFSMDAPNSPLQLKSSDLNVVSSKGEILFDREAGRIVESEDNTRLTGSLVLTAGGQDIPAELDLTITTGTNLKDTE